MVDVRGREFSAAGVSTLYQPIVRMSDRAPVGLEALARLEEPGGGMLPPKEFVPQVEETGRSWELTRAVIGSVLADIAATHAEREGRPVLGTWINMPLDVLLMPHSIDEMTGLRAAAGLDDDVIHIELTESQPVADPDALRDVIVRAGAEGFKVALDDYSPEMKLHRELLDLPFASVKFDHLLIAAAAQHPETARFFEGAVAAAQARGMTVVAEGVEDAATWDRLRALGVDAAQGFWIAAPLSPAEVEPWRRRWAVA